MKTTHELKVWPDFFDALADGSKPFEVRHNDRKYEVGDVLILREWKPGSVWERENIAVGEYTGRELYRRVTYVLHGMGNVGVIGPQRGVSLGFVVLGLTDSLEAKPDVERSADRAQSRDDSCEAPQLPGL